MKTHNDRGEFDRLKDELRRLKRAGAPWYFESELHRRIHDPARRHGRLAPFPTSTAFVITFVAIACLAGAAYLMMVQSGLFRPNLPAPAATDTVGQPSPAVVGQASSPVHKKVAQADTVGQPSPPVAADSTTKPKLEDTQHSPTDSLTVPRDTLRPPKSP